MIITHRHLRKAGICMNGARGFWKRHELDWTDFLNNGIEEEKLLATGDAQAAYVVEVAHG